MSLKGFKSVWFVSIGLLALVSCSGGNGNGAGNGNVGNAATSNNAITTNNAAPSETDQRVAQWGQLVGLSSDAAKQELTQSGLLDQVGKNNSLDETQTQAFLELTFSKDAVFSHGIDELNRRNQTAFASFNAAFLKSNQNPQVQPSLDSSSGIQTKSLALSDSLTFGLGKDSIATSPTFGNVDPGFGDAALEAQDKLRALRQKAVDDYLAMTAQTSELRQRILAGAQILGFRLEPATKQELLGDPGFAPIRDKFVLPVVLAAFAKHIVGEALKDGSVSNEGVASAQEIDFAGSPLAEVSFRVGNRFLSFYQFNTFIPAPGTTGLSDGNGIIQLGGDNSAPKELPTVRGSFKVSGAEENSFQSNLIQFPDLNKGGK